MPDEPSNALGQILMNLAEHLADIPAALIGYRDGLIKAGFNETAAEAMTIDYHNLLIAMLTTALTKGMQNA